MLRGPARPVRSGQTLPAELQLLLVLCELLQWQIHVMPVRGDCVHNLPGGKIRSHILQQHGRSQRRVWRHRRRGGTGTGTGTLPVPRLPRRALLRVLLRGQYLQRRQIRAEQQPKLLRQLRRHRTCGRNAGLQLYGRVRDLCGWALLRHRTVRRLLQKIAGRRKVLLPVPERMVQR